jgi:hypothetical protein
MEDPANWGEYKAIMKQYILPPGIRELSDKQSRRLAQNHACPDPQALIEHNQQPLRDLFTAFRSFLVANGPVKEEVLKTFTYENVIYNQPLIGVLQEYVQ